MTARVNLTLADCRDETQFHKINQICATLKSSQLADAIEMGGMIIEKFTESQEIPQPVEDRIIARLAVSQMDFLDSLKREMTGTDKQVVDALKMVLPGIILEALNSSQLTHISESQNNTKNRMDEFKNAMDGLCDKKTMECIVKNLIESVTKIINELNPLTNKSKGEYGEEMVQQILQRSFPRSRVLNTGKSPHSMDLELHLDAKTIRIEVKNKKESTKDDLEKFKKDVDSTSADGWIYVSLQESTIRQNLNFERSRDGKPIVYMGIQGNISFVPLIVNLVLGMDTPEHHETPDALVESILKNVQAMLGMASKARSNLDACKASLSNSLRKMDQSEKDVRQLEDACHALLKSLPEPVANNSPKRAKLETFFH